MNIKTFMFLKLIAFVVKYSCYVRKERKISKITRKIVFSKEKKIQEQICIKNSADEFYYETLPELSISREMYFIFNLYIRENFRVSCV